MLEIYSIESRKGGVGKTTIALNLAKALTRKKRDVLLIDCDITGTPITKATAHSAFWKNDVVVSKKNDIPYNLIEFFDTVFLKGVNRERELIDGLVYNPQKIHLIGSEIYDDKGSLIIDPRNLMDDLHSYWFLDFIKNIVKEFCEHTTQEKKAIILDNSPGYVGIGRSVREWLTKLGPDQSTFVLVSSLDEQDIDSTISSASEIESMMQSDRSVSEYVKVVINKVPDDLMAESGGYEFKMKDGINHRHLVEALFPLDKNGYPQNIIKYDISVSGQFIEARLIPKAATTNMFTDLESAIRTFDKKVASFNQKQDQYSDIASMDYYYRELLKALSSRGFIRMSKILRGELLPNNIVKSLTNIVGQLGNMAPPNSQILEFSKDELQEAGENQLYMFIEDKGLSLFSPIFISLYNGIYKVAGYERKGANIFQMFNLNIMLAAFYAVQSEFFHRGNDYRDFLKNEIEKKNSRKFEINLLPNNHIGVVRNQPIYVDPYITNLLNAYYAKFNQAMCYALLRMIDCSRDYGLLLNACKDTIMSGAKMMSEDLMKYLKDVVSKKSEEPNEIKYRKLVKEPYEMKSILRVMTNQVLDKA